MENWGDARAIQSIGCCIYCRSTENLTREHIIPYSLHGNFVFLKASCDKCRDTTRIIEEYCCRRGIFYLYRLTHKIRSSHKKERRTHWPVILGRDGATVMRDVAVEDYPIVQLDFPVLPQAGLIIGAQPTNQFLALLYIHMQVRHKRYEEIVRPFADEGFTTVTPYVRFNLAQFMRLLAKIAHGVAVAHFGIDGFHHLLPDYISGKDDRIFYVVGSITGGNDVFQVMEAGEEPPMKHQFWAGILEANGKRYATVQIQLFQNLKAPIYEVIAGEMV